MTDRKSFYVITYYDHNTSVVWSRDEVFEALGSQDDVEEAVMSAEVNPDSFYCDSAEAYVACFEIPDTVIASFQTNPAAS